MPTYDYECEKCGHVFETFQSMAEKPLSVCPKCKGSVKRLIGPGAGLIFKGSGFYITDYKNKGSQSDNGQKETSKTSKEKETIENKKSESKKKEGLKKSALPNK